MTSAGERIFYGLRVFGEPFLEDFFDESLSGLPTLRLLPLLLTLVLLRTLILSPSTSSAGASSGRLTYDSPRLTDLLETLRDVDFEDAFLEASGFA